MPVEDSLFPFEIIVEGVPASQQATNSRGRWMASVAEAARQRRREAYSIEFLDDRILAVTIYYFPSAPMVGDIDNIVKPILDGLISIAYLDDNIVERVVVQKFEPEIDWDFSVLSDQLANALDRSPPLVYIRVDDDLSWRRV